MEETTQIAGGVTVVDDGDFVSATNENTPAPIGAPVIEAEAEAAPAPAAEPEAEPKDGETDRDASGRFVPKEGKPPVERRKESLQAQIDRARYELGEEQRRLDRVRTERQQLEAAKPSTTPPPVASQGSTTFKDFVVKYAAENPTATYEDAFDAYRVVERAELVRQLKADQQQESEQREIQQLLTAHKQRESLLKATTPDWDAQANAADAALQAAGFASLPLVLDRAILRSEKSEYLIRHLIQHQDVLIQAARDAAQLPLTPAAVNLMRTVLESHVGNTGSPAPATGPGQPLRQSQAKAPPKPVGQSPIASASSDDEPSYEQVLERVTKNLHRR